MNVKTWPVALVALCLFMAGCKNRGNDFTGLWRDTGLDPIQRLSLEDKDRMATKMKFNGDGTGTMTVGGNPKASQSPMEPQTSPIKYTVTGDTLELSMPSEDARQYGPMRFVMAEDHKSLSLTVRSGPKMVFTRVEP